MKEYPFCSQSNNLLSCKKVFLLSHLSAETKAERELGQPRRDAGRLGICPCCWKEEQGDPSSSETWANRRYTDPGPEKQLDSGGILSHVSFLIIWFSTHFLSWNRGYKDDADEIPIFRPLTVQWGRWTQNSFPMMGKSWGRFIQGVPVFLSQGQWAKHLMHTGTCTPVWAPHTLTRNGSYALLNVPVRDWNSRNNAGGAREVLAALRRRVCTKATCVLPLSWRCSHSWNFTSAGSVWNSTNPVKCTAHCLHVAVVLVSHTPWGRETTGHQLFGAQDSQTLCPALWLIFCDLKPLSYYAIRVLWIKWRNGVLLSLGRWRCQVAFIH